MKLNQPKKILIDGASGFSLVELMVVVAIIGILASIAVPQFQSFAYKARLTEAKAGLTSIYTAEKAFFGEYMQYDPRFGAIGLQPEGQYFFNIGFSGGEVAKNYKGSVGVRATNTATYCESYSVTGCRSMTSALPAQSKSDSKVSVISDADAKTLLDNAIAESTPDSSKGLTLGTDSKVTNVSTGDKGFRPNFTAEAKADKSIHPRKVDSVLLITDGRIITQQEGAL